MVSSTSLLGLLDRMNTELENFIEPEIEYASKQEIRETQDLTLIAIKELDLEFKEVSNYIASVEPRAIQTLRPIIYDYSFALSYIYDELDSISPVYSRFLLGIENLNYVRRHFH
jgi:hypothetical protein